MKINTLKWSVSLLGLVVGLNSLAMGGQEKGKRSLEPSAIPPKSKLMTEKVAQTSKVSENASLIRVSEGQAGTAEKISAPLYQPPRRGAPGGRVGGGTRGPSPGLPVLYALVPDHVAVTAKEQPPLVWYLSKATSFTLEFTVLDGLGVEPVLEVPLASPAEAGIHLIHLGEYDLKFEEGKTYQWFVSLIPDPARRSKDIIAGGMLEVDSLPENIAEAVKVATPQAATKLLAQAGFWYDAMGVISQEIQANPTEPTLHDVRATLLEQVDLHTVAQVDRQTGL